MTKQTTTQPNNAATQQHNSTFSRNRTALLMQLDLCSNYKSLITFAASTIAVLFLFFLAAPASNSNAAASYSNFHPHVYAALLFIGGFYISSLAFKELHDNARSYIYLMLPCSNFEKFLNKLLLTSLGYVVALSCCYFMLSLIISGISLLLFNEHQPLFNPFHTDILLSIRAYLIWQSIFLLGSVYFRKHVMSKIIFTISCFAIILLGFASCTSSLVLNTDTFLFFSYSHWFDAFPHLIKAIFFFLLAPFCWFVAYLRLTEMELGE